MSAKLDVMRLAREAGAYDSPVSNYGGQFLMLHHTKLAHFASLVIEECAKQIDEQRYMVLQPNKTHTADELCIRLKGNGKYLAAIIRSLKP